MPEQNLEQEKAQVTEDELKAREEAVAKKEKELKEREKTILKEKENLEKTELQEKKKKVAEGIVTMCTTIEELRAISPDYIVIPNVCTSGDVLHYLIQITGEKFPLTLFELDATRKKDENGKTITTITNKYWHKLPL